MVTFTDAEHVCRVIWFEEIKSATTIKRSFHTQYGWILPADLQFPLGTRILLRLNAPFGMTNPKATPRVSDAVVDQGRMSFGYEIHPTWILRVWHFRSDHLDEKTHVVYHFIPQI